MYITKTDLENRYGDTLYTVAGYDNNGNTNNKVIDLAIADAVSEVNGYLRERYTVPLSPVPDMIKRFACAIAMDMMASSGDTTNETLQTQAKNARKSLVEISKGIMTLGVSGNTSPTKTTNEDVQYDAPPTGNRGIIL